jgi:acyl-CoA synthetase (AMP-forming)/AMP-acid ligase II
VITASAPRRLLDRLSQADPNRTDVARFTFLAAGNESTSFSRASLATAVDEAAAHLDRVYGLADRGAGGLVAILARTQRDQAIQFLGCLAAGLVPAILTPPNRKQEPAWYTRNLVGVLKELQPSFMVTDLVDHVPGLLGSNAGPAIATLGSDSLERKSTHAIRRIPDDVALVQFSSGTSGLKKAVGLTDAAVRAQVDAYQARIRLRPTTRTRGARVVDGDCVVSWLPLYHDMGLMTALVLPFATGTSVVMLDPIDWVGDPASYLRAVEQFGGTCSWHPNFAYAHLASRAVRTDDAEPFDLASLRLLVNCSEPVTDVAQRAFLGRFATAGVRPGVLTGCYAMAESAFALTHGPATDLEGIDAVGPESEPGLAIRRPLVTVGSPIDGVRIDVRSGDGTTVAERVVGELWVRAPFVVDRYLVDRGGEAFLDGWYRTGDLGYRVDDRFYVLGRGKDVIIVAGNNVYPEDVERIVGEVEGIRPGRVAAFGDFDERLQTERLTIVAERDGSADPDVVAASQRVFASLNVASTIFVVEPGWLVKSSSGKVARGATAEKWRASQW